MTDILLPYQDIHKLTHPTKQLYLLLDVIYVDKYGFFVYVFSIFKPAGYKKIGRITLWMANHETTYYKGNIGYNITKSHRRQGYATAACQTIINYLRTKTELHSLLITCNPDNIATQKICATLGATHVDTAPAPPHLRDHPNKKTKLVYELII